jgi:ATP-dependent Zn protease
VTKHEKTVAYHEAAHAVIARVLTLKCGYARLKRGDGGVIDGGNTKVSEAEECVSEWRRRGKVRDSQDAAWVARIITAMAGTEATAELLGVKECSERMEGDDREQIARALEEIAPPDGDRYEARLRRMTRMLVRRHKRRIHRVAKALLAKTTLNAK